MKHRDLASLCAVLICLAFANGCGSSDGSPTAPGPGSGGSPGTIYQMQGVHFADEMNGWAVGGHFRDIIVHATDGGATWTEQQGSADFNRRAFRDVWAIDTRTAVAVGDWSVIMRMETAGEQSSTPRFGCLGDNDRDWVENEGGLRLNNPVAHLMAVDSYGTTTARSPMTRESGDRWSGGDGYDEFMGRWSRAVAQIFIEWLPSRSSGHWLDVGCGTGALSSTICQRCEPASVLGCDPSGSFIDHARNRFTDERLSFVRASTENLPSREGGFDTIVSGLMLNFVPEPEVAVASMMERISPGGGIGAYVWDYAEGMMFLRHFWDEAVAMDPSAIELDEGRRFPLCRPEALASIFQGAGLLEVETRALEIQTDFRDFDDYWRPFLGGPGPAPGFVQSLNEDGRTTLRDRLRRRVPATEDGAIKLRARAWAVRGLAP